jgi:aminocarboxymuconate-semialdehyde decarboxylase
VYTSTAGAPLDRPELLPFFEAVGELGAGIWLHPDDVPGAPEPGIDLNILLGWPYQTSLAMARLAMAGTFERLPGLRILTHHAGGMIPLFGERLATHYGDDATRERLSLDGADGVAGLRAFYADTATSGSAEGVEVAAHYFGVERMLFASDMPFGPEQGRVFLRRNADALEAARLPRAAKDAVGGLNALSFIGGDR